MRQYCAEAVAYGNVPEPVKPTKQILLLLNPTANKRTALKTVWNL